MFSPSSMAALIERFCARDDLSTPDPYDIWKTALGFRVKDFYNRHRRAGFLPAAVLALFDGLVNNQRRAFYTRQEYPVVRAMAALCLLNLYRAGRERRHLDYARRHLDWLVANTCTGYSGYCWALGFRHAVSADVTYGENTPLTTITPYALEAFIDYVRVSRQASYTPVIRGVYTFLEQDVQVMEEDEEALATSYGPFRDRVVTNALAYTMYSYSLLLAYAPEEKQSEITARIRKLYAYIRRAQRADGSWYYSPYGRSFIDCFHSCIVLKNLFKTGRLIDLDGVDRVIERGYSYVKTAFWDERSGLFRRFSVSNKASLVKFDLYDNAEMLNLAVLLGDRAFATRLLAAVVRAFCDGPDIYSQIDFLGARRNRNTLRWAVMPFLLALSQMVAEGCL